MELPPNTSSDEDIIHAIRGGEINAFASLMDRYRNYILTIVARHIPSHEVEETVQEAWIRGYRALPTFNGTSGFQKWMASITVRTCYDFWRKQYRSRELPMSRLTEDHMRWIELVACTVSHESYREQCQHQEAEEVLQWALDRLSAQDRMVVELVHFEGYSVKEASALLGWSVATVKVRAFRSRKKLKRLLTGLLEK